MEKKWDEQQFISTRSVKKFGVKDTAIEISI